MKRALPLLVFLAGCNPYYDSWDYTPEVMALAAAEMHCDASQVRITPVPDRYGTHTFVADGCGCSLTYQCDNHDLDGCSRERPLESADASCH